MPWERIRSPHLQERDGMGFLVAPAMTCARVCAQPELSGGAEAFGMGWESDHTSGFGFTGWNLETFKFCSGDIRT